MKRIKGFSEFQEYLDNKTIIYILEYSKIYEMYVDEKCEYNEVEEEMWQLVSTDENSEDYLRIIQEDLESMFFCVKEDNAVEDIFQFVLNEISSPLFKKLIDKFKPC